MAAFQELLRARSGRQVWRFTPAVRRDLRNGLLFVSPWLIGLLVFTVYPIVSSFYYSFTVYDIVSPAQFVGLTNYRDLLTHDPLFWITVRNTLFLVCVFIPASLLLALSLALLLNAKISGMAFYRTVFFLPSIVPDVVVAVLWAWMLNTQFGLANASLRRFGLPTIGWMTDPMWTKPSLILIALWTVGGAMVIFLAAVQDIPEHLYEAADLDGASTWRKLWHVTLPMLTPTIFFNLVLGIIGTFQAFTLSFVLTGGSGGPLSSALFYAMLLYRNAFSYFKMGYASAMAWLLFAVIFAITFLVFRTAQYWVYYEGESG
ncbi:MAG: sugar ABC transporter permease [Chloroflexi bacterium]|nr:sugar ABC transporter permease [Chloroflexota bacterium]